MSAVSRQSGVDDPLSVSPAEGGHMPPSGPSTSGGGRSRGKEGKEKETFGCTFPGCGQVYSRMEYLKRHQRKHQDDRPFQCKDCTKAFARSDVLLRHRRRCHPTPPPNDRNSHSPPQPHRNYPGVPISSSRTDAREASPVQRGGNRKHPRQSGGDEERDNSRTRRDAHIDPSLEDFDAEDMDERYPESSQFGRHNSTDNGAYSADQFYGSALPEGATYTPHLLPLFQQANQSQPQNQSQPFHSLNDPDHLEDASVLLSMAYPGGLPGGENPEPSRDLPDWANNPTINMMMEAAVAANREQEEASRTNSLSSASAAVAPTTETPSENPTVVPPIQLADVDPALTSTSNDKEAGFLSTMNWLSGMGSGGVSDRKEGDIASPSQLLNELANGWFLSTNGNSSGPLSPPASSPFNFASLFSPSAVALPAPGSNGDVVPVASDAKDQPGSPTIQAILDSLAKYDTPDTLANPNPERPLLRVDHEAMNIRSGKEYQDRNSPFYVPADRFAGCYQIPHWALPPVWTMSFMASRTFHTVLNHFSFIHMPTFKLIDTAACLAFAMCTVGGIKPGNSSLSDMLINFPDAVGAEKKNEKPLDGPVLPNRTWETLYADSWEQVRGDPETALALEKVTSWENAQIVRSEKSGMLIKSFALAKGVLMTEYNVALLQALILYHAPNFLSGSATERNTANMLLGTLVNISRQIGFFDLEAAHLKTEVTMPRRPFTPNDLDRCWRDWIQLETRRRTAYLVYLLDTISSLESNIPFILSPCELSHVPLPAPDHVWKAPTALDWLREVKKSRIMTLDEAMRRIFFLPTFGAFDELHEKADTRYYNLLNQSDLGPFARLAMVITLLRGIIDTGEGRRDRGDWRDLTDLWISCSWLKPGEKMLAQDGADLGKVTSESLRGRFALGLQRWREGWDFDRLCASPATTAGELNDQRQGKNSISPQSQGASGSGSATSAKNGSNASSPKDGEELPKTGLNYCEDALPFYWLAQALLNILDSNPARAASTNSFAGLSYCAMLKTARTFTRTGEGVHSVNATAAPTAASTSASSASSGSGSGSGSDIHSSSTATSTSTTITNQPASSSSSSILPNTGLVDMSPFPVPMPMGFDMSLPPAFNGMGMPGLDMGIGIGGAIGGPGFGVGLDLGQSLNLLQQQVQAQGQGQNNGGQAGAGAGEGTEVIGSGGGIWGQGSLAEQLGFII